MGNNFVSNLKSQSIRFNSTFVRAKTFTSILVKQVYFNINVADIFSTNSLFVKLTIPVIHFAINSVKSAVKIPLNLNIPSINFDIISNVIRKAVLNAVIPSPYFYFQTINSSKFINNLNMIIPQSVSISMYGRKPITSLPLSVPAPLLSITIIGKKYALLNQYDDMLLENMDDSYLQELDYTIV
jgi:hypothetical protein